MLLRRNPSSPLIGFARHLAAFVTVNVALFVCNLFTLSAGGDWWFHRVLYGWGIGLMFHALAAGISFVSRLIRLGRF